MLYQVSKSCPQQVPNVNMNMNCLYHREYGSSTTFVHSRVYQGNNVDSAMQDSTHLVFHIITHHASGASDTEGRDSSTDLRVWSLAGRCNCLSRGEAELEDLQDSDSLAATASARVAKKSCQTGRL